MSTVIAIRRARLQDAAAIAHCLAAAFAPFRSQYSEGAFADTVLNEQGVLDRMAHMTIYVAVHDREDLVGTVSIAIDGKVGHLRGMAVCPEWQGHNFAQQLLEEAENDMRAAGCDRITLDTTTPLQRAIRFYQRNGYAPSGIVTDFFGMPLYELAKSLCRDTTNLTRL